MVQDLDPDKPDPATGSKVPHGLSSPVQALAPGCGPVEVEEAGDVAKWPLATCFSMQWPDAGDSYARDQPLA